MSSCSLEALAVGEPLAGTAPFAAAWIVIEQPGPWGRDALIDSLLDPRVAEHLSTAARFGISVLLARHPDRSGRDPYGDRHVWVARTVAGGHLLRHGVLANVDDLLKWDLSSIGAGNLPALGAVDRTPTTFVCTHSKRDVCCALDGRALINDLLTEPTLDRERIWECSHIGGHRFAPVMLTLPSGAVHGRITPEQARMVIDGAPRHEVVLERLRGLSGFPPPYQTAAIQVMRENAIVRDDCLDVLRIADGRVVPLAPGSMPDGSLDTIETEVRHVDGRAWRAMMVRTALEQERRESCAKGPVPGFAWQCVAVVPTAAWA